MLGAIEGQPIKPLGFFVTPVLREDNNSESTTLPIHVSQGGIHIIGRDGIVSLNICVSPTQLCTIAVVNQVDKLQEILTIHAEIFKEGQGCCTTAKATLILREEAVPNPEDFPWLLSPLLELSLTSWKREELSGKYHSQIELHQ